MEFRHGSLSLDLPSDWRDESTLLFIKPRPELTLPTRTPVEAGTEAVAIKLYKGAGSAQMAVEQQSEDLAASAAGFRVLQQGPFDTRLGAGWHMVQRYELDGRAVAQIAVAVMLGSLCVLATAACPEGTFPKARAQLEHILASLDAKEMS